MAEKQNFQKRQAVFSNSNWTSYDNRLSAMTLTSFNENLMVSIAPVFPAMTGKQPKKGEKVYDYDNKGNFLLSVDVASRLLAAIDYLTSNEAVKEVIVRTNESENHTEFLLRKPGHKTINKMTFDNYMLRCTTIKDNEIANRLYHPFQKGIFEAVVEDADGEVIEQETGLSIFRAVLKQVVDSASNFWQQGANIHKSQGGFKSAGRSSPYSYSEDEGDDDLPPARKSSIASQDDELRELEKKFEDDDI